MVWKQHWEARTLTHFQLWRTWSVKQTNKQKNYIKFFFKNPKSAQLGVRQGKELEKRVREKAKNIGEFAAQERGVLEQERG